MYKSNRVTHIPSSLTYEEKEHLILIYQTRMRNFLPIYIIIQLFTICFSLFPIFAFGGIKNATIEQVELSGVLFCIFAAPVMLIGILYYYLRVYKYWSDARKGLKERISRTIIRKSHFPHTDEYFLSFDDPNYMHHEVDAYFYHNCAEGTEVYLYRAPRSKYIFNKNGVFSLL